MGYFLPIRLANISDTDNIKPGEDGRVTASEPELVARMSRRDVFSGVNLVI